MPQTHSRWVVIAVEVGIAITILTTGAVWLGLHGPGRAAHEIAGFGNTITARIIFTLVYAATLAVGLPSGSLSVVGGSAFGFVAGSLLDYTAIALGAAGGYWLARLVGEPATRQLLRGRHTWLDRVRAGDKFGTLVALQVSPLVPNGMLNLAAGLARVDFKLYLASVLIGNAVPTLAYSYLGDTLLHTGSASHTPLAWIVRGIGIAVTLAILVPPIYAAVRRRHSRQPSPQPQPRPATTHD
jgi:uncharacterized membrane protein YdjX (TVP38/TMEM64 family)